MDPYLRPDTQQLRQGHPEAATSPRREANPLELLLAIANDPRNSWMGGPGKIVHGAESLPALIGALGPLFKSGRGWEVLKEYMLKGGTPQSLRELLRARGYNEPIVTKAAKDVHQGTDLAAPPAWSPRDPNFVEVKNREAALRRERYPESVIDPRGRGLTPVDQQQALEGAARLLLSEQPGKVRGRFEGFKTAGDLSSLRERNVDALMQDPHASLEALREAPQSLPILGSAPAGMARSMGRLMDDPTFLSLRQHYLPPPVSDTAYFAEHPIENNALMEETMRGLRARYPASAPQSFRAAENQRTSDLNRRADQNQ
jgi:hypothetical protein